MKRAWNYVVTMWQPVSAFIFGALLIIAIYSFRTGNLVPGRSPEEAATRTSSLTIKAILDNPINAPYKLADYTARHIHKGIYAERLVSGLAAALTVVLFYLVARRFCSRYAAVTATALFATNSYLLHNGRLAAPGITLLLLFALFVCGYQLRFNKHRTRSWLIAAFIFGISLYTPGLIYFIVLGAIWQYRAVKRDFEPPEPLVIGTTILIVAVLAVPLILGLVQSPGIWHSYLGIPASLPNLRHILINIVAVPIGLFVFAPINPVYRLGHQPVMDIFDAFMFLVGAFTLFKRYRLDRMVLFIGIFIIAIIYTALTGNYENSIILLPFIYLVVGMGIGHLIDEWDGVFPLNPLARWLALLIMTLAVIVSINFQLRRYFIAWPHNQVTRAVFSLK